MRKTYEFKKIDDVIKAITDIAEQNTATAKHLLQARGHKDFTARAHREKALFSILLLKELNFIGSDRYFAMVENLDRDFKKEKLKAKKEKQNKRDLEFEMLEYGDTVELENGDTCVYIRKELDTSGGIITQEPNLVNILTGDEHNINCYNDDLTHQTDPELNIKRFAN